MSCRGGMVRGGTSGLQPLKATVPFQLHKIQAASRDVRTAEKTKLCHPKSSIRRTSSLDTIIGPYLQGQWPKELDSQGIYCMNDKATQTPSSWSEEAQGERGDGGHRRSASWGSEGHLREISKLKQQLQQRSKNGACGSRERDYLQLLGGPAPGTMQVRPQTAPLPIPLVPLSRLTPRLRQSVEGFNQELEGVFVREMPGEQQRILDVPDGHRAPVPPQRCSSGCQIDSSPALLSTSPSPCFSLSPSLHADIALDSDMDLAGCGMLCPSSSPPLAIADPSFLQLSCSPRPNKSYSFQREPPEGCEKVPACDEAFSLCLGKSSFQSFCPDPNRVNFTPHGGSAFCPISLPKPLLPAMDFLFRNLSVSPVPGCLGQQGGAAYQPATAGVGGYLGPLPDSAATAL